MKVLASGPEWKKIIECHECHAQLEIDRDDLGYRNYAVFYAGETNDWHCFITCPECGTENQVLTSYHIEQYAKAKRLGH